MSRKRKASVESDSQPRKPTGRAIVGHDRGGLRAYTEDPGSYPPSVVLSADKQWVIIHDMFPKATVHLLILPRDPAIQARHPFDVLADSTFLTSAKTEASKWRLFVSNELRRRFGADSILEANRRAAMDADPPLESSELPPGRAWLSEVRVGVHAQPSMNDLHIHVISQEMHSERMKHRKHYNSFKTPFFVDLDDFPLKEDDVRRHPGREGYLQSDLKCWRCGMNFGNKFARLKEHLNKEFEEWKIL
jgi:aprataxin